MRTKLSILLRILSILVAQAKVSKPHDRFAMAAYMQGHSVRVISRSRTASSTYTVVRGQKVQFLARHLLHHYDRCWERHRSWEKWVLQHGLCRTRVNLVQLLVFWHRLFSHNHVTF